MRNEKSMHSNKKCKKVIKVLKYDYENSQSNDIALIIDKLKNNEKYEFNESAVLYRTNMESRSIIVAFIRKRIPFRLLDKEYNFFEHFICKDILAYLKLSIMPYDYDCFKRIINKPFRYISKINIEKVKNSYIKMDCFEQLINIEGLPVFQIKSISNIQKDIYRLDKLNLQSAIQYIINNLGYQDYLSDYCLKYKIPISELDEIIEEFKEAAGEFNTISTFLVHVESVSERLKSMQYNGNDNAVVLSTIHGVKGMEFKNVFIINCVDGVIPHVNNMEKDLEEERRLFFVGITRAIENLYIGIPNNIRGKNKEVSRFIKECNIYNSENYSELYKPGDKILHSSFGEGTVKDIDKEIIKIEFGDFIDRSFALNVLHNNGIIKKL
jgi:DNA helicase-2/ATP-dependent DNA helicase PcrA